MPAVGRSSERVSQLSHCHRVRSAVAHALWGSASAIPDPFVSGFGGGVDGEVGAGETVAGEVGSQAFAEGFGEEGRLVDPFEVMVELLGDGKLRRERAAQRRPLG
jgi:hypothetical protein